MILAPVQEFAHRLRIGAASVAVTDISGEEFDEVKLRSPGGGDEGKGGVCGTEGDETVHPLIALFRSNCRCAWVPPY